MKNSKKFSFIIIDTPINEYNPYSKMNSQISISKEIKNAIKNTQFKNSSLRYYLKLIILSQNIKTWIFNKSESN